MPLLLGLRLPIVQRLLDKPLTKARNKSDEVLGARALFRSFHVALPPAGKNRWTALAAFVGVPFPGTGAWTGAMIAFVIGMPLAEALTSILAGVVAAGLIVSALVKAGKVGAVLAALGIAAVLLASKAKDKDDTPPAATSSSAAASSSSSSS